MTIEEKRIMWANYIKEYRASGLTAADWCEKNDIKLHNLKSWIKKQNKAKLAENNETKWVALKPTVPIAKNSNPIVVTIGNSTISVQPGFDQTTFRQVAKILQEQC